jgi:hypothetical protein
VTPPLVPPVPQVPAGWGPVQADMTLWVTTPFSFLASPAVFRGELHAATGWTASTATLAPLDAIDEDPWAGWSATATGSQAAHSWLCPAGCSGYYEVTLTASTSSPGTTTDQLQGIVYVDGAAYAVAAQGWGVNGHESGVTGSAIVPLLGGVDYVQLYVYSTAATSAPATAGQYPTMEIAWLCS